MDTAQVLLPLLLLASVQLWACVCGENGEIWRWFNILFRVQLDYLVGDTWNRCGVILEPSQRGAAARMFDGRAVLAVY